MKKPWQIWLAFFLCLAAVVPAMVWLSMKTLEMDALRENDRRETEIARREAELQERISSALYRMDLAMLPLVTHEAARPHYFYKPYLDADNPGNWQKLVSDVASQTIQSSSKKQTSKKGMGGPDEPTQTQVDLTRAVPSPLLTEMPEFVLLHFQIGPNGKIVSPQAPKSNSVCEFAMKCGVDSRTLDVSCQRMGEAEEFASYDQLISWCEPPSAPAEFSDQTQVKSQSSRQQLANVYNVPALEQQLQMEQLQEAGGTDSAPQDKNRPKLLEFFNNKIARQRSRGQSRGNEEFNRRRENTQNFADKQWAARNAWDNIDNQAFAAADKTDAISSPVREGVMQPIWLGERLILARRVDKDDDKVIQCCWLDWKAIQQRLKDEVADLLPKVEFEPVTEKTKLNLATALTTLPVQLVVDSEALLSTLAFDSSASHVSSTSGLRLSLLMAWLGLGLAAIAAAFLLHGVMKLSERRATFVSAVTHELRTPLTTFRMYAEMLAEKMVPEEKQQEYADTLRVQADRLSHLVENVLQFARLERGADQASQETISVHEMIERFSSRLVDRAAQAEMKVVFNIPDSIGKAMVRTQPSTVEQIMFNLVDNACKYASCASDRRIEIDGVEMGSKLQFRVRDFGPGIDDKFRKRLFQPFCKSDLEAANSAPGVGLGLALCRRMATSLGGRLYAEDCDRGALFVLEIAR